MDLTVTRTMAQEKVERTIPPEESQEKEEVEDHMDTLTIIPRDPRLLRRDPRVVVDLITLIR